MYLCECGALSWAQHAAVWAVWGGSTGQHHNTSNQKKTHTHTSYCILCVTQLDTLVHPARSTHTYSDHNNFNLVVIFYDPQCGSQRSSFHWKIKLFPIFSVSQQPVLNLAMAYAYAPLYRPRSGFLPRQHMQHLLLSYLNRAVSWQQILKIYKNK